jgi:hypothetical protein
MRTPMKHGFNTFGEFGLLKLRLVYHAGVRPMLYNTWCSVTFRFNISAEKA